MPTIGLLFPPARHRAPKPPEQTAIGRAALRAHAEGLTLVMGDTVTAGTLTGERAVPGRWAPTGPVPVDAWVTRYPMRDRPEAWAAIAAELGERPVVNPPQLTRLCLDKLKTQHVLAAAGVPQPEVTGTDLHAALDRWGTAFLKPRFGAFGEGVQQVVPGTMLPDDGHWILQQAVPPPSNWAGVSVRVLVQRDPGGTWLACAPAVRRHATDAVVNRARGAEVAAPEVLSARTRDLLNDHALAAAHALSGQPQGEHLAELGVDLVIDHTGFPWVIEVNGTPRGRLAVLAERWPDRFTAAHEAAILRPFRFAAAL
ncbi:MAG: YheC/YheD family protein [Myxococcota bacterium]